MVQIMTLGEVLIDLTQVGTDRFGIPEFKAFPGGAPANVAVAAARLGARAGFIGKVGPDEFGRMLRKTLEKDGVETTYLYETENIPTTLAIVNVDDSGERSFSFYRDPGADTRLSAEEAIRFLAADGGDGEPSEELPAILHFGSLSLTAEPSRSAAFKAVQKARGAGIKVSYDPNYRPALWDSREEAVCRMKVPLGMVDILKISDEEMVLLTETDDLVEGSLALCEYGIRLIMVTLGGEGVFYRYGDAVGKVPAVPVDVRDTNGAGDTFLGAMLAQIAGKDEPLCFDEEALRGFLAFANRAAAITCSRAGAIPAMPGLDEINKE